MNLSVIQRIEFYIAPNLLNIEYNVEQQLSNKKFGNVYLGNYLGGELENKLQETYVNVLQFQLNQVGETPTMLMV